MFESFQNPMKGKGKEKDVGKRRAYVRVVTSLGAGLNLELFCEKVCNVNILCVFASEMQLFLGPEDLL